MPEQEEVSKGIGEMLQQGLGLFGQGVSAVAQVLKSGDAAVREVDGALTGGTNRPQQSPLPNAPSEEQVTHQVAALVRLAREEATRSGDPRAPGVMARFREAMRLLFQLPLPVADTGLSDIMPSPMEAARMGLRDLRGSMAMVRLANGTGSLADVEEVARFADEVAGRLQHGAQAPQGAAGEPTAGHAPAPTVPAKATGTRRRAAKRRRKATPETAAVSFARAVAEEMADAQVKEWAEEFATGKINESTWVSRLTEHAAETRESLDDVLARVQARMRRESSA